MSTTFKIAHLREQGQDIIIVPLDRSFGLKTKQEQGETVEAIQACAMSAGLRGTVVPVWDSGGGRMAFIAPTPWHPFFRSLTLRQVASNLNRTLTCG